MASYIGIPWYALFAYQGPCPCDSNGEPLACGSPRIGRDKPFWIGDSTVDPNDLVKCLGYDLTKQDIRFDISDSDELKAWLGLIVWADLDDFSTADRLIVQREVEHIEDYVDSGGNSVASRLHELAAWYASDLHDLDSDDEISDDEAESTNPALNQRRDGYQPVLKDLKELATTAADAVLALNAREDRMLGVQAATDIRTIIRFLEHSGHHETARDMQTESQQFCDAFKEVREWGEAFDQYGDEDTCDGLYGAESVLNDARSKLASRLRSLALMGVPSNEKPPLVEADSPMPVAQNQDIEVTEAPPKPTQQKPGRKKVSPGEEQRRLDILEDWERASEAGISRRRFCEDWNLEHLDEEDIGPQDIEKFQRWKQQRENRGQGSGR